jgi:hypothetical protein
MRSNPVNSVLRHDWLEVKLFFILVDGARLHVEKEEVFKVKWKRGPSKGGRAESGERALRNAQLEIEKRGKCGERFSMKQTGEQDESRH